MRRCAPRRATTLPARRSIDDVADRLRASLADVLRFDDESAEAAIDAIVAKRNEARKNKDFALGDRLRDALLAEGIALKDSKDGTTWTVAGT